MDTRNQKAEHLDVDYCNLVKFDLEVQSRTARENAPLPRAASQPNSIHHDHLN